MICNCIGLYLKWRGMTQSELAQKLGITEASMSRYVSGYRVPKATLAIRMAKELGCKVEDLFREVS